MYRLIFQSSLEILQVYFKHAHGLYKEDGWLLSPLSYCLKENNFDRVELLLGLDVDYNRGWYDSHPLFHVFACEADKEKKLQWLEKIAAGGIGKIGNKERFITNAVYHRFPEALDLAVRHGIDPHFEDEKPLRCAASERNEEMCLYLIENYGADLERAAQAARKNELEDRDSTPVFFLSCLRAKLKPPAPQEKPATIETLSREMKGLRAMIAELTQLVKPPQAVKLDKPSSNNKLNP